MKSTAPPQHRPSPWPHRCAWLLAGVTFPLIWVGGLVTTTDAGMAFPDWITSDGTFFLWYDWLSSAGDKFIEHGHRLLGALAGFVSIGLVLVTFGCESRSWVRKFSLVLLAGVILQGVLGGMRVLLDERLLAMLHGCTGPLFFLLCVAMVVFTSPTWQHPRRLTDPQHLAATAGLPKFFRLAVICTVLAYVQLVVGAVVRHSPQLTSEIAATIFQVGVYFHLFLALVLTGQIMLLLVRLFRSSREQALPPSPRSGIFLLVLVGLQLGLGLGTWLVKYGLPRWAALAWGEVTFANHAENFWSALLITCHVAVGSLILATTLTITLSLARRLDLPSPLRGLG